MKDVASALTSCNSKMEEITEKLNNQRSAQNTMPPSSTGNNIISYETKSTSRFSEALKTVSSPSFTTFTTKTIGWHSRQTNWSST